jgi:putative serine protease PepD
MTDDQTPEQESGSGRLWTQPREEDEHTRWLAPRTEVQPPPSSEREPDGFDEPGAAPPRRIWPFVAIGVLIAAILFGGGVLGASLLDNAQQEASSAAPAALPAVGGGVAPDARAKAVRQIVAEAGPSVVFIKSTEGSAGTASGTGFVIDKNGTIVTNSHVVAGASRVQVRFENGGGTVDAAVLGTDLSSDLAVLRVDAGHTQKLTPLRFADSDSVKVGDLTLAIGYPLGLDQTVTQGIVSAVNGSAIKAPNGFSIDRVIQTDAPINPGNSGGPLLDGAGRVIGINSQIATAAAGGGNVGIGFAVPSNTVRQVVPRLRAGAAIRRPYLGISTTDSSSGTGADVADVVPGGPAEAAGLATGDTVTKVGGQQIDRPDDISAAIENRRPGDRIDNQVTRNGARRTVPVTLGTRPERFSGGGLPPRTP